MLRADNGGVVQYAYKELAPTPRYVKWDLVAKVGPVGLSKDTIALKDREHSILMILTIPGVGSAHQNDQTVKFAYLQVAQRGGNTIPESASME